MTETDSQLSHTHSGRGYHDQPGLAEQNWPGVETADHPGGAAYQWVGAQITDYFESQRPCLLVDLALNLQGILYNFDGGAAQLLTDYDRILITERQRRRNQHNQITQSLIRRLGELNSEHDPGRLTEKELCASTWYDQWAINFLDSSEFHRTRLEITKLRLITCSDFGVDDFFEAQAEKIKQIAQDECLEAVNQIYSREMATCRNHCRGAAGEDPKSGLRQDALQNIERMRMSQVHIDRADIIQATSDHDQLRYTVYQLGELRRAWDPTINPRDLADLWLSQLGNQINSWVAAADNACHKDRYQIHQVALVGGSANPERSHGAG